MLHTYTCEEKLYIVKWGKSSGNADPNTMISLLEYIYIKLLSSFSYLLQTDTSDAIDVQHGKNIVYAPYIGFVILLGWKPQHTNPKQAFTLYYSYHTKKISNSFS